MVDLVLLSECHLFVGGFASQLSRLAVSLMSCRLGRPPAFVSVDRYPWGRHAQEEMWEIAGELRAAS